MLFCHNCEKAPKFKDLYLHNKPNLKLWNVYSAYKSKTSLSIREEQRAKLTSSPLKGKQETAKVCLYPPILPPQATEHKVIIEKSCKL